MKSNKKHKGRFEFFIFTSFLVWILLLTLWVFLFDDIRSLFPIPSKNNTEIVGYAQYYGYPLYFDPIMYFVLILSPAFAIVLAKLITKTESK